LLRTHGGHQSVDLYALFPLDMALKRLLSFNETATENCAAVLTAFYGTEEWRALRRHRVSSSRSKELGRALEQLYLERLRTRWQNAMSVADVRRGPNHKLYKMVFATDNSAAHNLAEWFVQRPRELRLGV